MMPVRLVGLVLLGSLVVGRAAWGAEGSNASSTRQQAANDVRQGNFKDAYEIFRKLALDPADDPREVGQDLHSGTDCLVRLNRADEIDAFRDAVIAAHQNQWRLLFAAAQNYMRVEHFGFLIAGKFQRGQHRGGGQVVQAAERDRVRALQLMVQAMPLAQKDEDHANVGSFFLELARMLLNDRGYADSWRLQSLTDLAQLPDYEPGWGYAGPQAGGAAVDEAGAPVFYQVPKSFADAQSDGQRWRWCLTQAMEFNPGQADEARMELANFLHEQFGVQTMADYGWFFDRQETDETKKDESGVYAVSTLDEDETIARLATGIKRFKLPDEFNYIKIYQDLGRRTGKPYKVEALVALAGIFQNRRQFPKAADYWRQAIPLAGSDQEKQGYQAALEQIEGDWGRFEPVLTQPAGRGATIDFRFRNAKSVEFVAQEIRVEKLLDDVKAYLKSRPPQVDWQKINVGDLGYRLVSENQAQYVGQEVARWKLDLAPREGHFDKRITVATPLQKAGAYLLSAKMPGGNTSLVVVWLADTAIAKKPLDGKCWYFVADAASGKPVAKANLEFFGWRQRQRQGGGFDVDVKDTAEFTDADGQTIVDNRAQPADYQWLITARTKEGRFAFLGFTNVWYGNYYDAQYNATKVYTITDRPVYRPAQQVHYKFWVRHAKYDQENGSDFAGQTFALEIHNPKNEKIETKQVRADEYGGIEGSLTLAVDATLGVYRLTLVGGAPVLPRPHVLGGGTFRVEEYKKPEYEVTIDAPKEPVMLGEKVEALIKAKYYFGSPVTKAKVKYKVERTGQVETWYPFGPWDWLYGRGYWWFACDYAWYPGWNLWGCPRPEPFWWPRSPQPPELVAEREVEIGHDGTVKVEIDTALAKAVHADQDHRYTITAEVVDQSRRTIVGSGTVLVARKPFTVTVWIDQGYYRAGDVIQAHLAARTIDGKPVQGKAALTLLAISYKDGNPVEKPVGTWDAATDAEGLASQQILAGRAGQYRLAAKVTDAKGHTIEGGYVVTVIGTGFESTDFRFNSLELIPDKADYQPGQPVKLMVNTDRPGGTVLLFVRPANGVYLPPRLLRLDGKSTLETIEVLKKDMPNFFVEALTIAGGKVYSEMKEIVVPPEKRVLSVEVAPSSETYKPGQKATVKIKLADFHGRPFVGSTVVAIYDKSVEYISGGSNVADIKEFFWKWRRQHNPNTESSLSRASGNLVRPNNPAMGDLGVFGGGVADEACDLLDFAGAPGQGMGGMGGGMGGMGGRVAFSMARPRGAMAMDGLGADAPAAPAPASPASWGVGQNGDVGLTARNNLGVLTAGDPGGGAAALVQPAIRSNFADTALWMGALTTDKDGTAQVALDMPESLTTWRIKVWAMGQGTKVGEGSTDVVTRKDLIVRMQAPRFFVQTDEVVLSANVHNYLKSKKSVKVVLDVDGKLLEPLAALEQSAEVPANDEARIDWRVKVLGEGQATIRMKALTDEESDAMEQKFPCYVHGMLKMEAWSGAIRPEGSAGQFTVRVPAQRRPQESRLEVRFSPTLAGAMVDALPYLVNYPYGCTEQTLNRFLPTVITQKVLLKMGLNLAEIKRKRTNLNAQELGDPAQRAAQWKHYDRNPVFDEEEVRRMVKEGLARLGEMQLSDGGWGWFSGFGESSSPHTTAYVVHGLQIARYNDVALVPGMLERGVGWLVNYQNEQVRRLKNAEAKPKKEPWKESADDLDALVYLVLGNENQKNAQMMDFLYRDRTRLSVYSLAMFGIALDRQNEKEKLAMILRNIGQYLVMDDEDQTAYLKLPNEGYWWYWYGSEYEAHAYYLKLLARTDPKGEVARRLVKYLLNNRKHASYWNSTRDTAVVIEAMADFLRASGEDRPEMTVEVWLDGQLQKAVEVTPATLFQFDNGFVLEGRQVTDGPHKIELRKRGRGPLYYNGYLTNFTLEDPIAKAGLEIKVQRKYYRLKEAPKSIDVAGSHGQVVRQNVEKLVREELADLATLKSGDLVEIELEIESKNDYEYLVFEDMKPAGFEPVDLQSGYNGNALGAYMEFRDNRVAMFVRELARGRHSVAYRMRAEIPGRFSALPAKAWAMYAPELKANSDEMKLRVSGE
jgi:uncharacterized protein YfaS (alpha-2-macroglobulin family)